MKLPLFPSRRAIRFYAIGVTSLAVLTGLSYALMRFHALRIQRQAEGLYAEVRSLEVGVSTYEDAMRLAEKHGGVVTFEGGGCSPTDCYFWVRGGSEWQLRWFMWLFERMGVENSWDDPEFLRELGSRPSTFAAAVGVRNGRVSVASFNVSYRTAEGHWLSAETTARRGFSPGERCAEYGLRLHQDYEAHRGSIMTWGGGRFIKAAYTPRATPEQKAHARDLNLACLTRVPDCGYAADLMPLAAMDIEEDYKSIADAREQIDEDPECKKPLELRDWSIAP